MRKQGRDRGFALLVVLWSLVLITLVTTQIMASGRTALALATNMRDAAAAKSCADGAINETVFHLLATGPAQWTAGGAPHVLDRCGMKVAVRVRSLAGLINPNLASTALLAGLFQAVGAAPGQAQQLASAIIAWRSPAESKDDAKALLATYQQAGLIYGPIPQQFSDISELADVIGMPPDLLAKAMPHMSLFQSGDPDPAIADAVVRRALALSGQAGTDSTVYEGTSPVVAISALVEGPGQITLRRDAIVSLAGADGPAPFQVLSLSSGDVGQPF
jgi:general secretion pathway protein K